MLAIECVGCHEQTGIWCSHFRCMVCDCTECDAEMEHVLAREEEDWRAEYADWAYGG